MAKVTVSLDADVAIDLMLRCGTRSPQDAVELVVRDYLANDRRTEARTGDPDDSARLLREYRRDTEG
ncbi:hypothetical protein [Kitasatospora sp. LaBMicrA B282]|uniref:hypothetical protein n=1 Tax=Kitasatospora sp. LaBMicrA B282 TaxID=3420949 RepID=UPI003D146477